MSRVKTGLVRFAWLRFRFSGLFLFNLVVKVTEDIIENKPSIRLSGKYKGLDKFTIWA